MAITKPLPKTNAGADAFISGAPDAKAPKAAPGQVSEAAGPRGIVKGKKFAYFTEDHHGDGKIAILVKISGGDEQAALIEMDADRYYRPAYFGDGWIAIRLDLGDTDWDAITDWLARSWRAVAPKKLTALMDAADAF